MDEKTRINTCRACQLQQAGAKTRIPIPHTCGKYEGGFHSLIVFGDRTLKKYGMDKITCEHCQDSKMDINGLLCLECASDEQKKILYLKLKFMVDQNMIKGL